MTLKIAVAGFRHWHMLDLYEHCRNRAGVEIVACSEEDSEMRVLLAARGIEVTHLSNAELIADVECDVIAIGDIFGRRGPLVRAALAAGRHVLSDKPLCTTLDDLNRIWEMAAERDLRVGCMLDLRDRGVIGTLREVIRSGQIGEVHSMNIGAQHPLKFGERPEWYYKPELYGGLFNDIAVHAADIIEWITGSEIDRVVAARTWNATVPQHPGFEQCGQAMLSLDSGAGVICDLSYISPDSFDWAFPLYWRISIWGTLGVAATTVTADAVTVYLDGESVPTVIPATADRSGGYLDAFLSDLGGTSTSSQLTTSQVLRATRLALDIQAASQNAKADKP